MSFSKPALGGNGAPGKGVSQVQLGNAFTGARAKVGSSEVPGPSGTQFDDVDELMDTMEPAYFLDLFGEPPSKQTSATDQRSFDARKLESEDQKRTDRNAHHVSSQLHSSSGSGGSTRPSAAAAAGKPTSEAQQQGNNGVVFNLTMNPCSTSFEVQEPPPRPAKLYQSVGRKIVGNSPHQRIDMGLIKGQTDVGDNMHKVRQAGPNSRAAVAAPPGKSVGGNWYQTGSFSLQRPGVQLVRAETHPLQRRRQDHLASQGGLQEGGAVVRARGSSGQVGGPRAVNPAAGQTKNRVPEDDMVRASTSGQKHPSARVQSKKDMEVVPSGGGGDVEGGRKRPLPVPAQECGKRVRQEAEDKSGVQKQRQLVFDHRLSFKTNFGGYSDRIMRAMERNYRRNRSSVMVDEGVLMTPYKFLKKICDSVSVQVGTEHFSFTVGRGEELRHQYRTELFCGPFCGVAHSEDEKLSWELAAAHVLVRMGNQFPELKDAVSYGLYPGMRNSGIREKTRQLCEAKGMSVPTCVSEDLWSNDRSQTKAGPRFLCYVSSCLIESSKSFVGKCKSDSMKYGMLSAARNLFLNVVREFKDVPFDVQMDDYYAIGHECPRLHAVRHILPYAPFRNNGAWKQVNGVVSTDDALHDESDQSPYLQVPPGSREFAKTRESWERAIKGHLKRSGMWDDGVC